MIFSPSLETLLAIASPPVFPFFFFGDGFISRNNINLSPSLSLSLSLSLSADSARSTHTSVFLQLFLSNTSEYNCLIRFLFQGRVSVTFTNTLCEGYKNSCIFTMRNKRITLLTHGGGGVWEGFGGLVVIALGRPWGGRYSHEISSISDRVSIFRNIFRFGRK